MSSPQKEELPRIADVLKSELVGEHKLKPTETQEKVVLPSQSGKCPHSLPVMDGCDDSTTHGSQDTDFPFTFSEIQQEKGQQELLKSIESFSPEKLHHADTEEKNPLPTKEVIEAEKQSQA